MDGCGSQPTACFCYTGASFKKMGLQEGILPDGFQRLWIPEQVDHVWRSYSHSGRVGQEFNGPRRNLPPAVNTAGFSHVYHPSRSLVVSHSLCKHNSIVPLRGNTVVTSTSLQTPFLEPCARVRRPKSICLNTTKVNIVSVVINRS